MSKYIYSVCDVESAIEEAMENFFGHELNEVIAERVITHLEQYSNLYRFYNRNCCGCVVDNKSCDFTYGRGVAKDVWKKAVRGELFDCPVRTSGTMSFSSEEGLKHIDLSDRDKAPYPTINVGDFAK